MTILQTIVAQKKREVETRKAIASIASLEARDAFHRTPLSLQAHLQREGGFGIIAEFKRRSPSRGIINGDARAENICPAYVKAGASAISVLTDTTFFGGSDEDLLFARYHTQGCPILRKEFIIDEYQVIEARSIGADAILLIADILDTRSLTAFSNTAHALGMEVLFEIHDRNGLDRLPESARIIGVNSRDLKNFSVSTEHAMAMVSLLPGDSIKVAESGIDNAQTLLALKREGYQGFLIGERFMRETDPGKACQTFISSLKQ